MEYKHVQTLAEIDASDPRTIKGFGAIIGNLDSGNDRIWPGAFRKTIKEQGGRIRHLWQHDFTQPPVAKVTDIREVKLAELPSELVKAFPEATGGLLVTRQYLDTPRGNEVLANIQSGAVDEMSIGYDPVKFDFEEKEGNGDGAMLGAGIIRNLREIRLWDTSDVNWGMNPAATNIKSAVPFKSTGMADEGASWSAPNLGDFTDQGWADLSPADISRITAHFAFTVNSPAENYGDLKLPHHQASSSGIGKAVWRGVAAAMGAMMGARGGVSIPDADRRSVYNHLAKHYDEFGKEPPEYKLVELSYLTSNLLQPDALKEGRVLSKGNMEKLRAALATLSEILLAAEPPDPEKALALAQDYEAKLRLLEADIYILR